ncbi:hypothetical protein OSTOST_23660, partial [Ostertagia ostertagi]
HESESRGDDECGKIPKVSDYLIHWGERASPGEIPWAALLLLDDSGWRKAKPSADPCEWYLEADVQDIPVSTWNYIEYEMYIYFPQDAKYGNPHDIAIVQLEKPVMEKGVWPICLPSEHDQILRGEIARVAGWGID